MKFEIGDKVQLKPSYAKWHLDNPEIYAYLEVYENDTLIHLVCCLGEAVHGDVIQYGNEGCFKVRFEVGDWSTSYYVDSTHVTKVDLSKLLEGEE